MRRTERLITVSLTLSLCSLQGMLQTCDFPGTAARAAGTPQPAKSKPAAASKGVKAQGPRSAPAAFREQGLFKGTVTQTAAAGEKQLLSGQYEAAARSFQEELNKNSRDPIARCGLGFALALQFKLDGAEAEFKKCLSASPREPLAHVGLAFVKVNRLQSSSMTIIRQRVSILKSAEDECVTALKLDPKCAEAYLILGMVEREQGNPKESIKCFTRAIQLDPRYSMSYADRGLVRLSQGETAGAVDDFDHAIAIRSSNPTAHYGRGKAFLAMGRLNDAHKELNTALSLNRNSAPIHTALGDLYKQQGNTNAALSEYQQAVSIKAENQDAYMGIADIREARGDLELAIAELRSGVEANPANSLLHRRMGDLSLRLEKTDDALKEYRAVLDVYPGDTAAIEGMVRTLVVKAQKEANGAFFLSNNFEAVEKLIHQAMKYNPNDMELALADAKLRALSGAPVDLSTIGTPNSDPQRIAYAEAMLAEFKFDQATQAMNTVIANCQSAKQAFAVADLALMVRDLDSAQAAYTKASSFDGEGVAARAARGQAAVSSARDKAGKEFNLAKDLARNKQYTSAIDKYRNAAYLNPRLSEAHLGLAETLEKYLKKQAPALREAALHYRAYMSLAPEMPEKEREKLTKRADKCVELAYKIETGQPTNTFSAVFRGLGNLTEKVGQGVKDLLAD